MHSKNHTEVLQMSKSETSLHAFTIYNTVPVIKNAKNKMSILHAKLLRQLTIPDALHMYKET